MRERGSMPLTALPPLYVGSTDVLSTASPEPSTSPARSTSVCRAMARCPPARGRLGGPPVFAYTFSDGIGASSRNPFGGVSKIDSVLAAFLLGPDDRTSRRSRRVRRPGRLRRPASPAYLAGRQARPGATTSTRTPRPCWSATGFARAAAARLGLASPASDLAFSTAQPGEPRPAAAGTLVYGGRSRSRGHDPGPARSRSRSVAGLRRPRPAALQFG
jgi:hypothetical protein